MNISRIALLLAVSLSALTALVAAGCGGDDDIPSDAVAVVDGTVITTAQLDELIARAKTSYASTQREFPKTGTPEFQSLQTQAVAYLVQRTQYEQEAERLGIEATDAQIEKKIQEILNDPQFGFGGDRAKLDAQLKEQGYTQEAFKTDVRAQVLSEGIVAQLTKDAKVTPADVKAYYAANKAQFTVAESRDVRHILVKTKAQADDVVQQLAGGADFAALAKKLSLDPGSKDAGGKLSIRRGETVPPFDKAAFALAVNQVSAPVKTEFGWHVIEPIGPVKPGSTTLLKDAEAQIRAQLQQEKSTTAIQEWTAQLEKDYKDKITYGAGFAPPATATDETQPEG
ncbi:MAG: peptidylprolyl isomerase [Gaiella sp.]